MNLYTISCGLSTATALGQIDISGTDCQKTSPYRPNNGLNFALPEWDQSISIRAGLGPDKVPETGTLSRCQCRGNAARNTIKIFPISYIVIRCDKPF